jgi:hypothetical protein
MNNLLLFFPKSLAPFSPRVKKERRKGKSKGKGQKVKGKNIFDF